MKMFLLMVLFSTPAEPIPHEIDGFGPRPAKTMAQCLNRRTALENYIEGHRAAETKFKVFCVEFEASGYAEAVESFLREIGDPL